MFKTREYIGIAIGWAGVPLIVAGVLTIAGEIYYYLKVGYWTPVTLLRALQEVGLSQLIDGFLALPFGVISLIAGIAIYWIGWRIAFGQWGPM
jgi:hypothetical protein